jgi:hypothetical protein
MNKVVIARKISASRLPEELRGDIPPNAVVSVRVEEEPTVRKTLAEIAREARSHVVGEGVGTHEAVARIRALRDEWSRGAP